MNDAMMKMCEEAVKVAYTLLTQRDIALRNATEAERLYEETAEALRIVAKERESLRDRLKDITSKLADAEAKIESFNAALDTEARR